MLKQASPNSLRNIFTKKEHIKTYYNDDDSHLPANPFSKMLSKQSKKERKIQLINENKQNNNSFSKSSNKDKVPLIIINRVSPKTTKQPLTN